MLDIQDLSKLTFTKVKDWAISFKYEDKYYLLHGNCDDYEYGITLYEKIDGNNRKLEAIKGMLTSSDDVKYRYIKPLNECWKGKSITYSHIDKEYFVKKLAWNGFCNSCFDKEIKERKETVEYQNAEIKNLERQIQNIRNDMRDIEEFRA